MPGGEKGRGYAEIAIPFNTLSETNQQIVLTHPQLIDIRPRRLSDSNPNAIAPALVLDDRYVIILIPLTEQSTLGDVKDASILFADIFKKQPPDLQRISYSWDNFLGMAGITEHEYTDPESTESKEIRTGDPLFLKVAEDWRYFFSEELKDKYLRNQTSPIDRQAR